MPQATVRWFDAERGFGFLALGDDAEDLFVHASEIIGEPRVLREGQEVEYELGEGDRGPQARKVRVTGDVAADATLGQLGTVSWYEPAKGYGFLTPDGGGAEIFVHSSAVVGGGVLHDGQRVAFLVVDGEKGPQADHLLPLGAQAAPAGQPAGDDGADGTVTWYDAEKGFGFVAPDDGGEDVFAHAKSLVGGLSELVEGDRVTFDVVDGEKGPQARDIRLVGGAPRSAPAPRGGRPAGRPGGSAAPVRGGEGTVARYDADRGFGFIRPDAGGDDLFVHVSVVRGDEPLEEGDRVRYEVRQSDRGPQADRVELVGAGGAPRGRGGYDAPRGGSRGGDRGGSYGDRGGSRGGDGGGSYGGDRGGSRGGDSRGGGYRGGSQGGGYRGGSQGGGYRGGSQGGDSRGGGPRRDRPSQDRRSDRW